MKKYLVKSLYDELFGGKLRLKGSFFSLNKDYLIKRADKALFWYKNGEKFYGPNPSLYGDCSDLWGNCSDLYGDSTGAYGNCSRIWGDLTNFSGECTDKIGDCSILSLKPVAFL